MNMQNYLITFRGDILEIGGGNNPLKNAEGHRITYNMDMIPGENVDLVHDLSKFPWPLKDNSKDGVFGKYVLEHISWRDIEKVLHEIYRIMRKGGKAIFFVPNTLEQCKKIVEKGVDKGTVEMIFGSQEFPDNAGAHKTGFSPEYAKKLFTDAGFTFVRVLPHPVSSTDLIIEAYKINKNNIFEREYFENGTIGYREYRDFATHYATARHIMKLNPESVLDVGGARGYIARILEVREGVHAVCMDISKHCWHNRATDSFILHDATVFPWPFKDKEFDLTFSINFLEHIPEKYIDDVIREMTRVSKQGLHGIHTTDKPFEELDPDIDITHQINKPEAWWVERFKSAASGYHGIIVNPRMIEYDEPERQPPITHMPPSEDGLIKLNIGSFFDMFYHGWMNIDILDLKEAIDGQAYFFKQHDVTKALPYRDNTVDLIFTSHLIEHLTRDEGKAFIRECYRVLKHNGLVRVSTPDVKLISKEYIEGKIWDYKVMNIGVDHAEDESEAYFNLLLEGHKTIYDEIALKNILEKAGFKDVRRHSPFESRSEVIKRETISTHPSVSCIIEGEK